MKEPHEIIDPWYLKKLVCPRDQHGLRLKGQNLVCQKEHEYPVIDGIPVMLLDNVEQTLWVAKQSIESAASEQSDKECLHRNLFAETLGIGEDARLRLAEVGIQDKSNIDPVVSELVGATNGIMYKHLIGRLGIYPIPELRWPRGDGLSLLDVGCNWGRWSIAAARKGYNVVGIDPSLGAIFAARRVSSSMGLPARFVVGDARYLPFPPSSFDRAFSYSVLQHFSREDCQKAVAEIGRALKVKGISLIQMPTTFGLRCLFHQAMRRFREPHGFEVRYWSINSLEKLFSMAIGHSYISVDCFFGIGLQPSDSPLMPLKYNTIIRASETLRKLSMYLPSIKYVADSVYIESTKAELLTA